MDTGHTVLVLGGVATPLNKCLQPPWHDDFSKFDQGVKNLKVHSHEIFGLGFFCCNPSCLVPRVSILSDFKFFSQISAA
jgi:hypothetical protein